MTSLQTLPPLGNFAYQAERLLTTDSKMSQILVVRDLEERSLIFKIACTAQDRRCASNRQAIYNSVAWLERIAPQPGIAGLRPIIRRTTPVQSSVAKDHAAATGTHQPPTYVATLPEWPGTPEFMVMDYLPGGTLSNFVRKQPLPNTVALWLTYRLAQTVAHLHAHGCVHRDLKPENILFAQPPRCVETLQALQPVLIDFGVAAGAGELKLICGSRQWMAPELQEAYAKQLLTVDPAWDIYALGLISCYLLSGLRPRRNAYTYQDYLDYQARVFAVLDRQWAAAGAETAAESLKQLLRQTLAQDPAARPTAAAFAMTIGPLLAGSVNSGPTDTLGARTARTAPVRRHGTTAEQRAAQPHAITPEIAAPLRSAPVAAWAALATFAPQLTAWLAKPRNRYLLGGVVMGLLLVLVLALAEGNTEQSVNAAGTITEQTSVGKTEVSSRLVVIPSATATTTAPSRPDRLDTDPPPTLAALPQLPVATSGADESIPTLAAVTMPNEAPPTLAPLPPTATATPRPSPTPAPTHTVTRLPASTPVESVVAPSPLRLALLAPAADEVSNAARVTFVWETVDTTLPADQCYELVFWDEQNASDKRSPVGAGRERQRTVNFATLIDSGDPLLQRLARSAVGFAWGVRLVDCANPRLILQDATAYRHYTYRP